MQEPNAPFAAVLTLVGKDVALADAAYRAADGLLLAGLAIEGPRLHWLEAGEALDVRIPAKLGHGDAAHWFEHAAPIVTQELARYRVDWALQPVEGRRKKLLVADMDSTIIGCECIDELADFAGLKAEIAAITEQAMRGEIGFEGALQKRVGMLKGLPLSALQACFEERVRLNPGARTLVMTMRAHGARAALVSGGFTFFTARVADLAGFDVNHANRLLDDGAALTGAVATPILGRSAKLKWLEEEAALIGATAVDALAIGDGANDLDMIKASGLGVAYRAKPIVAAEAFARIEHGALESALFFQGYTRADFTS
jgi:phosphoserine phosphatase